MNFGKELPVVLLALALGCGGRSALDVLGAGPLASGDDATVGVGPVEAGPSSSGSASSSGGSSGSSGSNGGSAGSGSGSSSGGSSSGSSGSSGCGPPSCRPGGPGMTNCGPNGDDCCCTSPEVTGGTYYRTYDFMTYGSFQTAADGGPTAEANPATVSGLRLDKYEVTVGRFRQFVAAWNGGWLPPAGSGKHTYLNGGQGLASSGGPGTYETGWIASDDRNVTPTNTNLACQNLAGYATWTNTAGSQENLPINCVNWWESYAFCIWDGGFLPSEAEFGYAAAGGNQQRVYPWGSTDPGMQNTYAIYSCYYPSSVGSCTGVTNIAPVGTATLGAGLWGQLDLAGEVYEWIIDSYATYVDPCVNCAYLTATSNRVFRGGRFGDGSAYTPRGSSTPSNRGNGQGLRCSRSP
jgi:sulfatase modifying factor 1